MQTIEDKLEAIKVLSHPVRIKILTELSGGVKCVSDFQDFLEISQPNVSQHLSLMRKAGVIDYYVEGRLRCYFIVSSMVADYLRLLDKDHTRDLPPPACCPVRAKGKARAKKECA